MAIELDLRRDLPKVREQFSEVLKAQRYGSCDYTAPCVVGAMIPPDKRAGIQDLRLSPDGNTAIGFLIGKKVIVVPEGQRRDFTRLQKAFDEADTDKFQRTLAAVEAKYLTVSQ